MARKEKGDADWDYEDAPEANERVISQPKTPGLWQEKDKPARKISAMATAHIFSCLRLIERKMWDNMPAVSEAERRRMTAAAVQQLDKYKELMQEFNIRMRSGKVVMKDLLLGYGVDLGLSVHSVRQ